MGLDRKGGGNKIGRKKASRGRSGLGWLILVLQVDGDNKLENDHHLQQDAFSNQQNVHQGLSDTNT